MNEKQVRACQCIDESVRVCVRATLLGTAKDYDVFIAPKVNQCRTAHADMYRIVSIQKKMRERNVRGSGGKVGKLVGESNKIFMCAFPTAWQLLKRLFQLV